MNYIHSELSLGQRPSIDFVCKSKQTFRENTNNTQQESEKERVALVGKIGKNFKKKTASGLDSPGGGDLMDGKGGQRKFRWRD